MQVNNEKITRINNIRSTVSFKILFKKKKKPH